MKPPCEPCGRKRAKEKGLTRVYANKANLRWCREKGLDLPCIVVEKNGLQSFVREFSIPNGAKVVQDTNKSPSVWIQFSNEPDADTLELETSKSTEEPTSGLSARAKAKRE